MAARPAAEIGFLHPRDTAHLLIRSVGELLPVVEHHDPMRQRRDEAHVVLDDHHGEVRPGRTDGADIGDQGVGIGIVHAGGGPELEGRKARQGEGGDPLRDRFIWAAYRTQLFNPEDLDNVKKVQAGYKAEPLSAFLHQPAPAAAPAIDFIKPLTPADERKSPEFFNILNFILRFCPTDPSETELIARFAKIGVGAGKTLDVGALSPEMRTAIEQGMADAWAALADLEKQKINTGKVTSGDVFGTRAYLKNNYLYRMAGAVLGIGGNSKQEAMYPVYAIDAAGQKLDGANKYMLHFAAGQLPPVNAFWSLTMYELPQSLLVANPINRYLINSPMLPQLVKDADGGLTLYVQNESPGKDKEPNWLPAPKGPFIAFMRLYWPKEAALDGTWKQPPMTKA